MMRQEISSRLGLLCLLFMIIWRSLLMVAEGTTVSSSSASSNAITEPSSLLELSRTTIQTSSSPIDTSTEGNAKANSTGAEYRAPDMPTAQVTKRTTTNIELEIGFSGNGTEWTFQITGIPTVSGDGEITSANITFHESKGHYVFNATGIPGSCLDIEIVPFSDDGTVGANLTLNTICYAPAIPTANVIKRTTTNIELDIGFSENGTAGTVQITGSPTVPGDGKRKSANITVHQRKGNYVFNATGIPGSCLDIAIVPFSDDGTVGANLTWNKVCYAPAIPTANVTKRTTTNIELDIGFSENGTAGTVQITGSPTVPGDGKRTSANITVHQRKGNYVFNATGIPGSCLDIAIVPFSDDGTVGANLTWNKVCYAPAIPTANVIKRTTTNIELDIGFSENGTAGTVQITGSPTVPGDGKRTSANITVHQRKGNYVFNATGIPGSCLDIAIVPFSDDGTVGANLTWNKVCYAPAIPTANVIKRTTTNIELDIGFSENGTAGTVQITGSPTVPGDGKRTSANITVHQRKGNYVFNATGIPGSCLDIAIVPFSDDGTVGANLTWNKVCYAPAIPTANVIKRTTTNIELDIGFSENGTAGTVQITGSPTVPGDGKRTSANITVHQRKGNYVFNATGIPGSCLDIAIVPFSDDGTVGANLTWNKVCYAPAIPTANVIKRTTTNIELDIGFSENGTAGTVQITGSPTVPGDGKRTSANITVHQRKGNYVFNATGIPGSCLDIAIVPFSDDGTVGANLTWNKVCYAPAIPTANVIKRTTTNIELDIGFSENGTAGTVQITGSPTVPGDGKRTSANITVHQRKGNYVFNATGIPGSCLDIAIVPFSDDGTVGANLTWNKVCYAPAIPTANVTKRTTTNIELDIGFSENGTAGTVQITGSPTVPADGKRTSANITVYQRKGNYVFNATGIPGSCLDIAIVPFSDDGTIGANLTWNKVCYAPAIPTAHVTKLTTTNIELDIGFSENGTAGTVQITGSPTEPGDGKRTSANITVYQRKGNYVFNATGIPGSCLDIAIVPFSDDGTVGANLTWNKVCYAPAIPTANVTKRTTTNIELDIGFSENGTAGTVQITGSPTVPGDGIRTSANITVYQRKGNYVFNATGIPGSCLDIAIVPFSDDGTVGANLTWNKVCYAPAVPTVHVTKRTTTNIELDIGFSENDTAGTVQIAGIPIVPGDGKRTSANITVHQRKGNYVFNATGIPGSCLDIAIVPFSDDGTVGANLTLNKVCYAPAIPTAHVIKRTTTNIELDIGFSENGTAGTVQITGNPTVPGDGKRTSANITVHQRKGNNVFNATGIPGSCLDIAIVPFSDDGTVGANLTLNKICYAPAIPTAHVTKRTTTNIELDIGFSENGTAGTVQITGSPTVPGDGKRTSANITVHQRKGHYVFNATGIPGSCLDIAIVPFSDDGTVGANLTLNKVCYAPAVPTAHVTKRTTTNIELDIGFSENGTAGTVQITGSPTVPGDGKRTSANITVHERKGHYVFNATGIPGSCLDIAIVPFSDDGTVGANLTLNKVCYATAIPTAHVTKRTTTNIELDIGFSEHGTAGTFQIKSIPTVPGNGKQTSDNTTVHQRKGNYVFNATGIPGSCLDIAIVPFSDDGTVGANLTLNTVCYAPAIPTAHVTKPTTTSIELDIGFSENGTAGTIQITGSPSVPGDGKRTSANITVHERKGYYVFNATGIPGSCLDIVILPFSDDGTVGASLTLNKVCYVPAQPQAEVSVHTTTNIELDIGFSGNGTAWIFQIKGDPAVDNEAKNTFENITPKHNKAHYVFSGTGTPGSCLDIDIVAFSFDGTAGEHFLLNGVCYAHDYTAAIAVPVVLIPSIASTIIIVFVLRRKRMLCFTNSQLREEGVNMHNREQELTRPKANLYRPIKLAQLREYVANMHKNTNLLFSSEYKELKEVEPKYPTEVAQIQACRSKNRYTNILAFDHSRVKLLPIEDEAGSDYINANYIQGLNGKREYIATQGPLPSTNNDFWRMVWEQKAAIIVMLTKCKENGKVKCDQYWPEVKEPIYYGELVVNVTSESIIHDYVIRVIEITLGKEIRKVFHFSYLNWPDMGCPKDPTSLINFVTTVRKYVKPNLRTPIIVHCSAGVGRTGTFIAIDYLMQFVQNHGEIDIFHLVYQLRDQRCNMVQTEDQYVFIHDSMVHFLAEDEDEDEDNHDLSPDGENIYENTGFIKD